MVVTEDVNSDGYTATRGEDGAGVEGLIEEFDGGSGGDDGDG